MQDDIQASARVDAQRAHAYFRALAGGAPRVGPFTLNLSPRDSSPYANYAIPDDDADPSADQIASLVAAFRERARTPRLEYVPAAAARVEARLLAAGFTVELRPPFMTKLARQGEALAFPARFAWKWASDRDSLSDFVRVSRAAFGEDGPGEIDARGELWRLSRGGRFLVASDGAGGAIAGAGAFMPPHANVTEIVGVAVAAPFRRQGLGQAIAAQLAQAAFDSGCEMAFLSAAGASQEAIYARAGFISRAPMLFIAKA